MNIHSPLYFINEFIEELLVSEKVVLTEEQKKLYIPKLSAIVEEEIGGELMKKLDDVQLAKFGKLFSNSSTTASEWQTFWQESIPNFSGVVDGCMQTCGEKLRVLLSEHS